MGFYLMKWNLSIFLGANLHYISGVFSGGSRQKNNSDLYLGVGWILNSYSQKSPDLGNTHTQKCISPDINSIYSLC